MKQLWYSLIIGLLFWQGTVAQSDFFVKGESVDIYVQTFGKGEPVLIINGGPGFNSEGFQPLAKRIADMGYEAILFDQRGTGQSRLDNEDMITMDYMVADIEAIRQHMGIKKWVVLGHSFGGMLGSYYASLHPDNICGLILSSSGGVDLSLLEDYWIGERLTTTQMDSLNFWSRQIQNGDTARIVRKKRSDVLAHAYVYDKKHTEVVSQRLMQGNRQINTIVWRNMRNMAFDCKPGLKNFNAPALIIHGAQDVVPESIAENTASVIPNSRVVILDQCGHYGWLDQPEKYFGEIEAFLGSI